MMTKDLTHKERLRRAIHREQVDRLPNQISYTKDMQVLLAAHFNVPLGDLPVRFDNHLVRVDLTYPERIDPDIGVNFDWWGAGHDTGQEGYYFKINPLAELADLDSYPWPDPYAPGLMEQAQKTIEQFGNKYFIVPNLGFALFERAWSLRGLERFLMDMVLDPGYTAALLDRITEIQIVLIHRYLELNVDGGYFGDDHGAQNNLMMSPATWRTLIKPRLARLFAPFRERGLPILMHSDGRIQKILPDLVEIGLTMLNPVQPEVVDHTWLRKNFGDQLAFFGGMSTQTVLSNGTPSEVSQAVAACRANLAPDNTGLLLAPSHRMMTDIPMENVEALLASFQKR
jgi:uroporphyrinogen decarboxylase